MALARWQRTIVDNAGNILPGAQVTVRREVSGAPLAVLYSDRDGAVPLGNPFTADAVTAFAAFHAAGGAHRIDVVSGAFSQTLRYVAIGTAAEHDLTLLGVANGVLRVDGNGILRDSGLTIDDNNLVSVDLGLTAIDGSSWAATKNMRLGADLDNPGTSTPASANEFGLVIHNHVPDTGAAASYQKSAALFIGRTADVSDAGAGLTKDIVGLDRRGYIASTNTQGRAWGGVDFVYIEPGGDGLLIGNEIDIYNNGVDQPLIDQVNSKYGSLMVAYAGLVTVGMFFARGGSSTYQNVIYADPSVIEAGGHFIRLLNAFEVTAAGDVMAARGLRVGFTGTPAAADRVEIGDDDHYLELASGTTPQWAVDASDALQYDRTNNQFLYVIGGAAGLVVRGNVVFPAADDGVALGATSLGFSDLWLAAGGTVRVNNVQVLTSQGAAVADASGGATIDSQARTAINALLARVRAHGLIAT